MKRKQLTTASFPVAVFLTLALAQNATADPCGMVPPIYPGNEIPLARMGQQRTYVFYKDGIETIVIRPGFTGKVEEFGMLVPFPAPPAVRKAPDHIFEHIAAAVDPPEVLVNLRLDFQKDLRRRSTRRWSSLAVVRKSDVKVLREEAVGMYEVAVLQAGSAAALKRWMDAHNYRFPNGMEKPCDDYVKQGWCFVAVKTRVSGKKATGAGPGIRGVKQGLPPKAAFDGFVQAMGFRFPTTEMVTPMRLSAFNKGSLRNIVYLLTDSPQRIRHIPEEYVVRQIDGATLVKNLTAPLPLRIIGGTEADIPAYRRKTLPTERQPGPKNGAARDLFASDLQAVSSGKLSLAFEEHEKMLLNIGERLSLRGAAIDQLNASSVQHQRKADAGKSLERLTSMTLTVVDGDFPRDVIAAQNLKFDTYNMPAERNNAAAYHAGINGPAVKKQGILKTGALAPQQAPRMQPAHQPRSIAMQNSTAGPQAERQGAQSFAVIWPFASLLLAAGGLFALRRYGRPGGAAVAVLAAASMLSVALPAAAGDKAPQKIPVRQVLNDFSNAQKASAAVEQLVARADESKELLMGEALEGNDLPRRGWAIIALSEIGGEDIDAHLARIHDDASQKPLVRTWAAAARVAMCDTADQLIEKAVLVKSFPALGRPVGMRLVEKLNAKGEEISAEGILGVSIQVPALQSALAPAILAFGSNKLISVMTSAKDQSVRRQAAAYIGAIASQGDKKAPGMVVQNFQFSPVKKDVPWKGGPLFVPGLQWSKEDAKALAANLLQWHLWCDINNRAAEKKQIHNNIRSLSLAGKAGYTSPGFQEVDTPKWLAIWAEAYGAGEVRAMLKAQGVEDKPRYTAVLK